MNRSRLQGLTGKLRTGQSQASGAASDWQRRRGETQYHGQFDVIGNFPGFVKWAALIVNARIEVTSHYLLIDEFAQHGFGISLNEIIEYSVDRDERSFGDVIIHFRPENRSFIFRLRPSRGRIPLPTRTNPTVLAAALADNGLAASEFALTLTNTLSITWESSNTLEDEDAVWTDAVTAPLRPGLESAPNKAWLTKNSLIWGSPKGTGLNRLPAGAITGVTRSQLADGKDTPIAWVHTDLIAGVDLALPYIFNQGAGPQTRIDRDTFVGLFHPDLIREIEEAPAAPWSEEDSDLAAESLDGDDKGDETDAADLGSEAVGAEDVSPEAEADFSAWESATRPSTLGGIGAGQTLRHLAEDDPGLFGIDPGGTRLVEALASWPTLEPEPVEVELEKPAITEPEKLLTYLARAKQAIAEVNENIDRRLAGHATFTLRSMPPSSSDQADALFELIELGGTGYYSPEQQSKVKAEIAGLGEASVRLRSLLELCNAGHMTIAEAGAKRDRIMSGIAMLLESG